jgi:hypothetical protein
MNLGLGVLVFFVSLIALVAEFILYFILGIGTAFSTNSMTAMSGLAFFFVGLMIFTGSVGVLFPACAILATLTKNKRLGNSVFLSLMALILIGYFSILPIGMRAQNQGAKKSTSPITKSRPAVTVASHESKAIDAGIASGARPPAVAIQPSPQTVTEAPAPAAPEASSAPPPEEKDLEKDYIKEHLVLKNVKVDSGYGQFDMPGYSTPKKGVFGNVKNTGERSIGSLRITVYFLDEKGLRCSESSFTVISTDSIMGRTPALKPNYSKDFGYIVEKDAPSEWAGKVEVEISNIRFE